MTPAVTPFYEIFSATTVEDATAIARTIRLGAAVLDVNVRGIMSWPLAHILEARGIPFVFATGYGPDGAAPGLEHAPVLCKRFSLERLHTAIDSLIRQ